jgi:phosphoheptose isomerase
MNDDPRPGTPVVVLDRDGTLNVEVNYLSHPDQVVLIPGVADGLRRLRAAGCRLIVVTNQSAIGRGFFDEARLGEIHERLRALLADEGVTLDAIYHCPHRPDDGCRCRKPGTELVERAASELGFDPSRAFVVGDKPCDIDLGRAVGAHTVLVRTGYGLGHESAGDASADFVVDDLSAAAGVIIGALAADERGHEARSMSSLNRERQQARVQRHLEATIDVTRRAIDDCVPALLDAVALVTEAFRTGGKLMLCGNGGSAADCQHVAAELVSRLTMSYERPGLPALALTTDSSFLTAFTNDINFEDVFARQVQALGRPGDVLLGISTSGNSTNVVRAVEQARSQGIATIGLLGAGGVLPTLVDVAIRVPSTTTMLIQQTHLSLEHALCDLVERELYGYEDEQSGEMDERTP